MRAYLVNQHATHFAMGPLRVGTLPWEHVQLVQAKISSPELTLLRAVRVIISTSLQNKLILVAFHFTFGLSGSRRTKRRLK